MRNLKQVPTFDKSRDEIVQTIRVSTVNARSLKHNDNLISEEILNSNINIAIITETRLKNTDEDNAMDTLIRTKQLLTSNIDKK